MSQKYTEVEWTDETPTEPGTLINKARLDQMQSAHHYADGFEEVDTIPTADPGVDYHKVVYCTADSTFYRWDGSQWTKDIDDETKALLLAHEADHANPHQVTKAQVGLGDVVDKGMDDAPTDSSDNYVKSGGVKTALDGKLNIIPTTAGTYFYAQQSTGPTRYAGTSSAQTGTTTVVLRDASGRFSVEDPTGASNAANKRYVDNSLVDKLDDSQLVTSWGSPVSDSKIASEKLTKDTLDTKADTTALTDGSVTKVGTGNVGSDTKPIKLVAGVPTAVTDDLVDTTSTQYISGAKTFNRAAYIKNSAEEYDSAPSAHAQTLLDFQDANGVSIGRVEHWAYTGGSANIALINNVKRNGIQPAPYIRATVDATGKGSVTAPTPGAGASSTEVATVGYIDGYAPMVRTTGNQSVGGIKTFSSAQEGTWNGHRLAFTATTGGNWYKIAEITNITSTYLNQMMTWIINTGYYNATKGGVAIFSLIIPNAGAMEGFIPTYKSTDTAIWTNFSIKVGKKSDGTIEIFAKGRDYTSYIFNSISIVVGSRNAAPYECIEAVTASIVPEPQAADYDQLLTVTI